MIGNTSRDSASAARKLWLLLAIVTLLLLTMAAGDRRETDVGPSLLVDSNAIRYKILGHRMICSCGCQQVLLECNRDPFSRGPCETAIRMRGELRTALGKGDSDEVILHAFAQKYRAAESESWSIKNVSSLAWFGWGMGLVVLAVTACIAILHVRKRHRPAIAITTPLSDLDGVEADMLRRRVRTQTENDDW